MEIYHNCMRCMNRRVRVLTRDGRIHEGTIVRVDRDNVYLDTDRRDGPVTISAYGPYGYGYGFRGRNTILTLSLFTLLAIALI
ncbi:hypothetical protein MUG84_21380 [Paenibacillus sp. KQZ6P-2]|uniref:Cellobiose phosphorylase n=1 Tax=Paenibacillus mangrovi TaxID=2931978 RepID=A0A9X1WY66_9BACL|nr:hypothetical protein [Paenibacillus mangrovi]MCJ8014269.1 hypothetical protein [Paenibacillus mangrovi]